MTSYYKYGQIKIEGNSKNGNRDGAHTWYYINGQIKKEGNFKDGRRDGQHTWYYKNGQLREEYDYKNGSWIKYSTVVIIQKKYPSGVYFYHHYTIKTYEETLNHLRLQLNTS